MSGWNSNRYSHAPYYPRYYYEHNRMSSGQPNRNKDLKKSRIPLYRNLRDPPQAQNQESIFANMAKKHKRRPEIPVVNLLDDDESTNRNQSSEEQIEKCMNDILVVSDVEDGELFEVKDDSGETSSPAKPVSKNKKIGILNARRKKSRTSSNSISPSSPEVICLSDSDIEMITENPVEDIIIVEDSNTVKRSKKSNKCNKEIEFSKESCFADICKNEFHLETRFWRYTQKIDASPDAATLRICSYNVLCQLTMQSTSHLYKHIRSDPYFSDFEYRWVLLMDEIQSLAADVFCMQEVQYDHYSSHFLPFMTSIGYGGFYKKKTGQCPDGCAIFYKKEKYASIRYNIVEYFVKPNCNMDRDQIGQILRLRCHSNGQEFIIANTHVLFNKQRGDIKIGQLAVLFAHIDEEMKYGDAPLLLMGDFNIEPYSYVYSYISEAKVFLRGLPRNELAGQGPVGGPVVEAKDILPPESRVQRDGMFVGSQSRTVENDTFTHPFKLASVYSHLNMSQKKDVSTSHVEHANPDFIFYSIKKKLRTSSACQVFEDPRLRLLKYSTLPHAEHISETTGPLPTINVPSDHLPLLAEFLLTPSEE